MNQGVNANFNVDGYSGKSEMDRFGGKTDGKWHHIAVIFDRSDKMSLYIYGKEASGESRHQSQSYYANISDRHVIIDAANFDGEFKNSLLDSYIDELEGYGVAPNKDEIKELAKYIDEVKSLDLSEYTREGSKEVKKSLKDANKVLSNKNATQGEVDLALENLSDAKNNLIVKNDSINENQPSNGNDLNNEENSVNNKSLNNKSTSKDDCLPRKGKLSSSEVMGFSIIMLTIGTIILKKQNNLN